MHALILYGRNCGIDDYAKDGRPGRSDIYVVFTKILCGRDFCVW